jgi:predicted S18 family serine protease
MPLRRLIAPLTVVAALTLAGCGGEPPDKELQQAQNAIDTAKDVGADQYAHDEFKAAQDALAHAKDAVSQRDYRLALNHALDARDRAQTAARETASRKAAARLDAERALGRANVALATAHAKLKTAEANHVSSRTLAGPRHAMADAESAVQKARAAMEQSDFPAVVEAANAATPRLQAVVKDLDAPATAGPRRRH